MSCVARRRDRRDLELPGDDSVAVVEGAELVGERHGLACGDRVSGPGRLRKGQAPADVVVVNVGLEHRE